MYFDSIEEERRNRSQALILYTVTGLIIIAVLGWFFTDRFNAMDSRTIPLTLMGFYMLGFSFKFFKDHDRYLELKKENDQDVDPDFDKIDYMKELGKDNNMYAVGAVILCLLLIGSAFYVEYWE